MVLPAPAWRCYRALALYSVNQSPAGTRRESRPARNASRRRAKNLVNYYDSTGRAGRAWRP